MELRKEDQTRQYYKDKWETHIIRIHKRNTVLEQSVNKILEGLSKLNGSYLTSNSDLDLYI